MKSDYKVLLTALTVAIALSIVFIAIGNCSGIDVLSEGDAALPDSLPRAAADSSLTPRAVHLQPFDPNSASYEQLQELGLSDYVIRNIMKYRSRGGVYQSKESFAQVYGLTLKQYRELEPYITIANDYLPAADFIPPPRSTNRHTRDSSDYPRKLRLGQVVALNSADTTALKTIPGIGSYYANRIVDLRTRYGGFVSLDQLNDINNFPPQSFDYLTLGDDEVKKVNINTADFRALQQHPYIGYNRARQITDYRRLKGTIHSLDDLSLLEGFGEQERQRLIPYIEY